jgi:hypothetical protein
MLKQRPRMDITCSIRYHVQAQVHKVTSHFIQSARNHIVKLYDLHSVESDAERMEFIESLLAENNYLFPVAEHVEGGVRGANPMWRVLKASNEWPVSTLLSGECNPGVYLHQILSSGE